MQVPQWSTIAVSTVTFHKKKNLIDVVAADVVVAVVVGADVVVGAVGGSVFGAGAVVGSVEVAYNDGVVKSVVNRH